MTVENLRHGGIIANYQCTAACRHCLYACSPERTGGYITKETAESVCKLLRAGGCRSVHIGGGEPFLDFDGLLELIQTVTDAGIAVEYIETNAYWAADKQQAVQRLKKLARAGADTLCISLDPFHAEYVPADLPLSLAKTCQDVGFRYFLWQDKYLPALSKLAPGKAYSRAELEQHILAVYPRNGTGLRPAHGRPCHRHRGGVFRPQTRGVRHRRQAMRRVAIRRPFPCGYVRPVYPAGLYGDRHPARGSCSRHPGGQVSGG